MKDEEMHPGPVWAKSISRDCDRWQSLLLGWIIGIQLIGLTIWTLRLNSPPNHPIDVFLASAIIISTVFAVAVWLLKAATPLAAVSGSMICFLTTVWTASPFTSIRCTALAPLVALFGVTFLATRAGRSRKTAAGLAERKQGRNTSQIIANLSMAALCAAFWAPHHLVIAQIMCLAALAEATADTVSSEIGQAFGGTPYMLTNLLPASPGTDGAITLLGTLAGISACGLVVLTGAWSMQLSIGAAAISLTAAISGLFFDSLLGATVERRGWIGNDLVNFSSTAFAAALAATLFRHITF
jgi:uncharacterized protein (TIGR00297 family)